MKKEKKFQAVITDYKKNIMGTVSFTGLFTGMRKAQDFIVYPVQDSLPATGPGQEIKIQSDTRFGKVDLFDGMVTMSQPHPNGSNFMHLYAAKHFGEEVVYSCLAPEVCEELRSKVKATGGALVGSSVVKCENTGAIAL